MPPFLDAYGLLNLSVSTLIKYCTATVDLQCDVIFLRWIVHQYVCLRWIIHYNRAHRCLPQTCNAGASNAGYPTKKVPVPTGFHHSDGSLRATEYTTSKQKVIGICSAMLNIPSNHNPFTVYRSRHAGRKTVTPLHIYLKIHQTMSRWWKIPLYKNAIPSRKRSE